MLFKLPKSRVFSYQPKYYEPPNEEDENEPRIKFRRIKSSRPLTRRSVTGLIIFAIILIFLLGYWLNIDSSKNNEEFKFEEIEIKQIQ